ncbi:MAG: hypothetical protein IJC52_05400 [Clostridia bacterium]|nr:hypothetical protein [Clostridia bacterium]
MITLAVFFAWQYRPLMLDTACNLAKNTANETINQVVSDLIAEELWSYDRLIRLSCDAEGRVTALQADAAAVNHIKATTALRVREAMSEQDVQRISAPLGTLCGFTWLSGRGPSLPCLSLLTAIPTVTLEYHFDGAGINQTVHSVWMVVHVPLSVTLPLQSRDFEVKAAFMLGETVLLGEVPDAYTNVISDPEVADDIFNYGDVG